ncbi:glutathione peroxidase 2 [Sigmodon hispidus]
MKGYNSRATVVLNLYCTPESISYSRTVTMWEGVIIFMDSTDKETGSRRLVILGFPCNQFGHQENCQNEEILNSLKYVRPGGGYQPTFTLTQKCDVNGQNEHPVFAYLKDKLPYPYDDPFSLMTDPKLIMWSPVRRSDVSWNFEKFLIGPEGEPFRRYSRTFQTINIEPDIKRLLKVAI